MALDGWQTIPLQKLLTLQRGHDLPEPQRQDGEVPVMGSFGITGTHSVPRAKGPGVTVGRSGASFGAVSYIDRDYWPLNTVLYATDFHGNDERFAYYFLRTLDLQRFNSGSAQPSLNRNFIHPLPVTIPQPAEQRAIASVLGALDDKIELNRRMNETLEAMARAIFKSWFVDFDPVRAKAEGRPPPGLSPDLAALFPDALRDTAGGETPVDWQIGTALSIANLLTGGTPKTSVAAYWDGSIPWASAKDVSQCGNAFLMVTERSITEVGLVNSASNVIPARSTVVVARGATTGLLMHVAPGVRDVDDTAWGCGQDVRGLYA